MRPWGQEWYIENIFEMLDAPGEWFFDVRTKQLYLSERDVDVKAPNSSHRGRSKSFPLSDVFKESHPRRNASQRRRSARGTFMEKFEVPSAGDWAIYRGAAVFMKLRSASTWRASMLNGGNGVCVKVRAERRRAG